MLRIKEECLDYRVAEPRSYKIEQMRFLHPNQYELYYSCYPDYFYEVKESQGDYFEIVEEPKEEIVTKYMTFPKIKENNVISKSNRIDTDNDTIV
jgi:hypothetical protein